MNGSPRGPIDLNLFRVFDAVYRAGSITHAAAQLHLSQPAVSNALARLRLHLEDPLFVRQGRRVVPTPLARGFADDVARALASLKDAARSGHRFDPAVSTRRFVVGMRDVLEFALLPPLVQDLAARGPHLGLHSTRLERRRMSMHLGAGDLDLAIDVPIAAGDDVLRCVLLRADLHVAMREGHPLASRKLTIERWLSARHVVVSARASGPVIEDVTLAQLGLTRDVAVRCQHYSAAAQLVAASDLLLTLPRYDGRWLRTPLPLHLKPMPLPIPPVEISMYWHRSADADAGNAWLRERIQALATRRRGAREGSEG